MTPTHELRVKSMPRRVANQSGAYIWFLTGGPYSFKAYPVSKKYNFFLDSRDPRHGRLSWNMAAWGPTGTRDIPYTPYTHPYGYSRHHIKTKNLIYYSFLLSNVYIAWWYGVRRCWQIVGRRSSCLIYFRRRFYLADFLRTHVRIFRSSHFYGRRPQPGCSAARSTHRSCRSSGLRIVHHRHFYDRRSRFCF